MIVGLAKPFRWIINNPESLSQEKIKKEAKLVKLLVQIKELSNFFVSAILCINIVEILEMADILNDWRDLKPPFALVTVFLLILNLGPNYFRMTGKMKILFSISIWVSSDWKICMDTCSQGHHCLTSSLSMWLVSQQWAWPVTMFYLILIF